jgi:methyl-accepting chemotaxis protein
MSLFKKTCIFIVCIFSVITGLGVYVSKGSINAVHDLGTKIEALASGEISAIQELAEVRVYLLKTSITFRDILISQSEEERAKVISRREDLVAGILSHMDTFEKEAGDRYGAEAKEMHTKLKALFNTVPDFDKLWKKYNEGESLPLEVVAIGNDMIQNKIVPIRDEFGKSVDAVFQKQIAEVNNLVQESKTTVDTKYKSMYLAGTIYISIMIFAVITMLGLVKSISKKLEMIMNRLWRSTDRISRSGKQIEDGSSSLSNSTHSQVAAVQETVAAMSEMSSMISQTGEYAKQCLESARKASNDAETGQEIMQRLVSSMEAIQEANSQLQEMSDIIAQISSKTTVINDIVFKTQLLSFNASIEAARAGQHGRGFAVVAEEVGNLAELSGNAAKEIQALIEESRKKVDNIIDSNGDRVSEGKHVSSQALNTFNSISESVGDVNTQIEGINNATKEQEIGVAQTSNAMRQIDNTSQMTSNVSKKAADSALVLRDESHKLQDAVASLRELIRGKEEEVTHDEDSETREEGELYGNRSGENETYMH